MSTSSFRSTPCPPIYNSLSTSVELSEGTRKLTFETALHLGNGIVRAVSLQPTDGLVRGQEVVDSGAPITRPGRRHHQEPCVERYR